METKIPKHIVAVKEEVRIQTLPSPDEAPLTTCPWCGKEYLTTEEMEDAAYEALEQENLYRHKNCGRLVRFYSCVDDTCPKCRGPMNSFSGQEGIPAHNFCIVCMDYAYDDDMKIIGTFE